MFGIKRNKKIQTGSLDETIKEIKLGNSQLKELLIENYKPFILKCVSKSSKKFIDTYNSEEYSIGLIAFNEAIECYEENKNAHFLTFAEMVIDRRVKNYLKKEQKHKNVIPITNYLSNEDQGMNIIENDSMIIHFDQVETRSEIEQFKRDLGKFDIRFEDLINVSPKHKDARISCIKIAKFIISDKSLLTRLVEKKNLPVKDIMNNIDVSERTLERNRKYIIAACLVLKSDLEIVKGFLLDLGGGV